MFFNGFKHITDYVLLFDRLGTSQAAAVVAGAAALVIEYFAEGHYMPGGVEERYVHIFSMCASLVCVFYMCVCAG